MKVSKVKGNWEDNTLDMLVTVCATFIPIYPDGAKDPKSQMTVFSVCIPSLGKFVGINTPKDLSVYAVEMLAIPLSSQGMNQHRTENGVICLDSLWRTGRANSKGKRKDNIGLIYKTK